MPTTGSWNRAVGSSLCLYFCGSSVILKTPLRALGYQVTLVAAALPVEWLIYQAQQHSCLGRIPLQVHAWPGDLWYFGWQTSCLCPAWYFPVKSSQGFPFSKRHYPSSHSLLSPSSTEYLADERSTPFCSEHTNPQAATSLPDSTALLLRRSCISIFTSWKGHVNVQCSRILSAWTQAGDAREAGLLCADTPSGYSHWFLLRSDCHYPGVTSHSGRIYELFWWEEHTCHLILLISTTCLWNYMEFSFFSSFLEKRI